MNITIFAVIGAALLTLILSPSIRRRLIDYSEHSLPKPEHQGPKYAIGGRYVTRDEFERHNGLTVEEVDWL